MSSPVSTPGTYLLDVQRTALADVTPARRVVVGLPAKVGAIDTVGVFMRGLTPDIAVSHVAMRSQPQLPILLYSLQIQTKRLAYHIAIQLLRHPTVP